jgi:hypothetical protein
MPGTPKGHKRPADVIGNAVHITRIATDEIPNEHSALVVRCKTFRCSPTSPRRRPSCGNAIGRGRARPAADTEDARGVRRRHLHVVTRLGNTRVVGRVGHSRRLRDAPDAPALGATIPRTLRFVDPGRHGLNMRRVATRAGRGLRHLQCTANEPGSGAIHQRGEGANCPSGPASSARVCGHGR